MKTFLFPFVLAAAGVSVSCVHQTRTASCYGNSPASSEKTRQVAAFERQVMNAKDAGEGDYIVRSLRKQMASEPDNLAVRSELIDNYNRDRQSVVSDEGGEHHDGET